ncbi:MAG: FAD binding domain-containing protein [Planctomycetota bacterium]|jgi:xanthine dehydrogenase YagS FAD-binding subunit
MKPFTIAQPKTFEQAGELLGDRRFSLPVLKAGGMDVLDHLKEGLAGPDLLINIRTLRQNRTARPIDVQGSAGGSKTLRIEATATLAEIAASALIREQAPVIGQAAGDAATPQVRNAATAAGNLLQRPRCWYYRNEQFHCLKKGGGRCYAVEGENKFHAIFSEGPCYIVHPSNLAPALYVLDGSVHVIGGGRESVPVDRLYHAPDRGILDEHNLEAAEVVTHLAIKAAPHSAFYAIKEKQSFDWPLVMAAVALELRGDKITAARVCAGAVAPVPWPLPRVERALVGVSVDDAQGLRRACTAAGDKANPMTQNAYKVDLLPVAVARAVRKAAGRSVES